MDRKDRLELLAIFDEEITKEILNEINQHDGSKTAQRKAFYIINSIKSILADNYQQSKLGLPSFIRNITNIAQASKKYENAELGITYASNVTLYSYKIQESEFIKNFFEDSNEKVIEEVMANIFENARKNPTAAIILLKIYGDADLIRRISNFERTEQPKEVKYNFDGASKEDLDKIEEYHKILKQYAK
jgi:hypothetical protein